MRRAGTGDEDAPKRARTVEEILAAITPDDDALLRGGGSGSAIRVGATLPLSSDSARYNLQFRAWIGQLDEIDTEEPEEWFEKTFSTLDLAKAAIYNTSLEWTDGEWAGHSITISFRHPPVIEHQGAIVSRCEMTDWNDLEFEWVDES